MLRVKNKKTEKVIFYAIILLILYQLQAIVFAKGGLLGVKPVILPLAVAGVAIFEGSTTGGTFGLFAGMLFDISYAQPLIEYTILLTALGIVIGLLSDSILSRRFPSYLLCCVVSLIVVAAVQILGVVLFSSAEMPDLIRVALRQTACSLLFAIPIYFPIKAIGRI